MSQQITVSATVNAPLETAWKALTEPEHITRWNFASDDWHCPQATNDLRVGGSFSSTMAARDGSSGFEFGGEYTSVTAPTGYAYTMGDGRHVQVTLEPLSANETRVSQRFDAEGTHSEEMQRQGWQAILENYRKHAESLAG